MVLQTAQRSACQLEWSFLNSFYFVLVAILCPYLALIVVKLIHTDDLQEAAKQGLWYSSTSAWGSLEAILLRFMFQPERML